MSTVKVRCKACRKHADIMTPPKSEIPVLWECPSCDARNTYDKPKG